jgi:hypothetical protein
MKKVISFSLWGDNPKYCVGAVKNAELAKDIYPDWICRYHVGSTTPSSYVEQLEKHENVEVILRGEHCDWTASFWRFEDASDLDVSVMISRDTDSRLNLREKKAVDVWLKSGKKFHIMRDHPFHGIEIMAGMWGVRGNFLGDVKHLIKDYYKGDFWQVDQNFLKDVIYPIVCNNACVHDEFFENKPFPSPRIDNQFVGQVYDEKEETVIEHVQALNNYLKNI